ncbi:hypothetical protein ES703_19709 [subsurface metagenome]
MTLGEKIKLLGVENHLSQKELANKVDGDQVQISGYERGEAIPSSGIVVKLARVLNVTTDYLLLDEEEEKPSAKIKAKELLDLFNQIEQLNENDKNTIKEVIQIAIAKNRTQIAAQI